LCYYTKNIDIYRVIHGEGTNHNNIAESYRGIADAYTDTGEYTKSLHYLTLSLDMIKAIHGDNTTHIDMADTYHKLGRLFHNTGHYTHSVHCYNMALVQGDRCNTAHLPLYTAVLVSLRF